MDRQRPTPPDGSKADTALKRSLSLPLVTLYGLGVTIGAGIYVLIGEAAARAGVHAPLAFILSALAIAPSAASFAELAQRYPVSAGEAAYVKYSFGSALLSQFVGLLVVAVGVISSAAITLGAVGYIQQFITAPDTMIIVVVLVLLGGIAMYGILESVSFAAFLTIIEIGGLLLIIAMGFVWNDGQIISRLPELVPSVSDISQLTGFLSAALITVFAFMGFEDIVNIAEEVKQPQKNLPRAIFLTLIITSLIYVLVASVAVLSVPIDELAKSTAPLSLVFDRVGHLPPATITAIAIVATLNGVIVQMIMAARVVYGMAGQGLLPGIFKTVHPKTRTPVYATLAVIFIVGILALAFPLGTLAETTSRIALVSFALVNLSLLRFKVMRPEEVSPGLSFALWVPLLGFLSCVGLLTADAIGAFM